MKAVLAVIAVALVALFLFQGPSESGFREDDPAGYSACQTFDNHKGAGGSVFADGMDRAADEGLRSQTPEIVDAVDDGLPPGREGAPVIDDWSAFEDACEDAGYDFP